MKKLMIGALLTLSLLNTVPAHEYEVGELVIDHPYTRSTPPMTPVAGGFMTITNNSDEDDKLISGKADFTEAVEIHEMVMGDKGVMRMQQLIGGLVIPAGKTVELKPGGLHIMFIGLDKQMIPDERHTGLLTFENAGEVKVEFVVKDITAEDMDHSKMEHGDKHTDKHDKKDHAHH